MDNRQAHTSHFQVRSSSLQTDLHPPHSKKKSDQRDEIIKKNKREFLKSGVYSKIKSHDIYGGALKEYEDDMDESIKKFGNLLFYELFCHFRCI
jgi:hypothetical protein